MVQEIGLPWLLVATPQLQDENFKKAVVLVVEDGDEGSMGFVINRPTETPLGDLLENEDLEVPPQVAAWYGGPVETDTGIILHRDVENADFGVGNVGLSSSQETLEQLIKTARHRLDILAGDDGPRLAGSILYPFRFIVGYAGWGAGQLEEELRSGAWIQAPATDDLIFNANWRDMWSLAMASVGVPPSQLAPSHQPYLN